MCTGWRARLRAILVGTALMFLISIGSATAQSTQEAAQDLAHQPGAKPLGELLMQFAAESGIDLLYDPELVAGRLVLAQPSGSSLEDRLSSLLAESDLTFSRLPSGTYVLVPRPEEARVAASIRGEVFDRATRRPLGSAHVLLAGTDEATATDAEGLFSFEDVRPGVYRVVTSHLGYAVRVDTVTVVAGGHASLRAALRQTEVAISPIVIEDSRGLDAVHVHDRLWMSRRMEGAPTGLSQDVVRSLNNLMGVRVGDAMADIHVQGGEAGEHQFRLDGVPVFEPVHLRGLLGAFNPFAIGRVTVHKAGFGAEYGSHLAGVIAAEHALTTSGGHSLDVQIDPLSLNARLDGSFNFTPSVRARFMTAARTSLWSVYPERLYPTLKNLLRDWNTPDVFLPQAWFLAFEQQVDPEIAAHFSTLMDSLNFNYTQISDPELGFGDFHFAGDVRLGRRHVLYSSLYRGWNRLNGNRLTVPLEANLPEGAVPRGGSAILDEHADPQTAAAHRDDYSWVNMTMQIQHEMLLSSWTFLKTRVRSSQYNLTHAYNALAQGSFQLLPLPDGLTAIRVIEDVRPTDNGNGIHEIALESTLDHQVSSRTSFSTGLEAINTRYRFAIEDVTDYRPLSDSSSTWRYAGFGQVRFSPFSRLQLTFGTRLTLLPQRDAAYVEPRAEARYVAPYGPLGPWSAWAATGLYRQFVNQFNVSSVSPSVLLPAIRFWLPIDASVSPPKALHVAGGVALGPLRNTTLRAEGYYKHQPHVLFIDYVSLWDQRRDEEGHEPTGQDAFLDAGRGYGYGGALSLERETLRSRMLLRYEYSIARRSRTLLSPDSEISVDAPGEFIRPSGFEPVPWNAPHHLDAAASWSLLDRLTLSVRWRSIWGRAWAFRQSYYDYLATDPYLLPSFGSSGYDLRSPEDHLLPAFHQLDLGITYGLELGPTACQLRLDLLNALNRKNEADWTLQPDEDGGPGHEYRIVPRRMLPRTPTMTLRLRW